ncbi:hypothetical protein [Larsenimonas suaedae]|uniref:Phosphatidate cytidylyltransferase n=1 Tax=Larsenimonas suaedae TaxID=1851019 RepID=A0ABU1GZ54_9GAMM|nr:hypothetical protein [Larsenimonas suaedae]MCM2973805.1 hypothetical protein [Larsenimonas suaedae]MDR5897329.1 hypothetical protein [Larsenimonas suaedae]
MARAIGAVLALIAAVAILVCGYYIGLIGALLMYALIIVGVITLALILVAHGVYESLTQVGRKRRRR